MKLSLYVDDETVFEGRGCDSCLFLEGYVSLWCVNGEAAKSRGTHIPGIRHCDFWEPHYGRLVRSERAVLEDHGYKKPSFFTRCSSVGEVKFWV